ncbi:GIY-YIG nuclease family protein [Arthrobacter sp. NPDC058097]|uniref:GIY-YIG nuclease family protein n=1 Tax=Arthrobacter sp. NPDC058097 TaxID=3346340 RepID=UPI0036DB5ABB
MDVPCRSLLDPARRIPFAGRLTLPETPGLYAWWDTDQTKQTESKPDEARRPLYLGTAKNLAAAIEADATGIRASAFRKSLAALLAGPLNLRQRTNGYPPPPNRFEKTRLTQWMSAHLLISWSELPHPDAYHRALVSATDPHIKP